MALLFEWDKNKAAINLKKHGVSFEEASTVFADVLSITIPDPLHSSYEKRFIITGCSFGHKILVVVHVDRGDRIRLISAREATKRERMAYEEKY